MTVIYRILSQLWSSAGSWLQAADLDMIDPSKHYPLSSGWLEVNGTQGIRGCQKLSNTSISRCLGAMYAYPTDRQYSSVCGRAIGYQIGGIAAFGYISQPSIDTFHHYGLSLTHGMPLHTFGHLLLDYLMEQ